MITKIILYNICIGCLDRGGYCGGGHADGRLNASMDQWGSVGGDDGEVTAADSVTFHTVDRTREILKCHRI